MKNLSFDDGRVSFTVNQDPGRVIRFNPADPEILNRILDMQKSFADYRMDTDIDLNPDGTPRNDVEKAAVFIGEFTSAMRKTFNEIFNSDVYDAIFDGQSPLCVVNQNYLFEEVTEGLMALMKPAIEAYSKKSHEKMRGYLKDIGE